MKTSVNIIGPLITRNLFFARLRFWMWPWPRQSDGRRAIRETRHEPDEAITSLKQTGNLSYNLKHNPGLHYSLLSTEIDPALVFQPPFSWEILTSIVIDSFGKEQKEPIVIRPHAPLIYVVYMDKRGARFGKERKAGTDQHLFAKI